MTTREIDSLLGRQFSCSFRVEAIGARPASGKDEDRTVTLWHLGEKAVLSLGELWTLIETGFVAETVSGPAPYASTRRSEIERLYNALVETTRRYVGGMMTKPTWKAHMTALWRQVDAVGAREDVIQRLGPESQEVKALWLR
jgi:hypothetical protein